METLLVGAQEIAAQLLRSRGAQDRADAIATIDVVESGDPRRGCQSICWGDCRGGGHHAS